MELRLFPHLTPALSLLIAFTNRINSRGNDYKARFYLTFYLIKIEPYGFFCLRLLSCFGIIRPTLRKAVTSWLFRGCLDSSFPEASKDCFRINTVASTEDLELGV